MWCSTFEPAGYVDVAVSGSGLNSRPRDDFRPPKSSIGWPSNVDSAGTYTGGYSAYEAQFPPFLARDRLRSPTSDGMFVTSSVPSLKPQPFVCVQSKRKIGVPTSGKTSVAAHEVAGETVRPVPSVSSNELVTTTSVAAAHAHAVASAIPAITFLDAFPVAMNSILPFAVSILAMANSIAKIRPVRDLHGRLASEAS